MSLESKSAREAYWKENIRLIYTLLVIWFVVSYGFGILLFDVLNQIQLFGYKLGFWFAQQGSIYCFLGLVFYYTKKMGEMDRKYGLEEEE